MTGFSWRRQRRFLTVDFDSRHVRIVQAEQAPGGARILKLAAADVPTGLDVTDAQAIGKLIRETVGRMRSGGTAVLMGVPRSQVILKPLVLPRVAGSGELASMIRYQAEKELTFRPSEAVIDFTLESHFGAEAPPEEEGEGQQVLVAAVRQSVVDYYKAVAHAAGLKLVGLGLRPYANIRCVQTYGRHGVEAGLAVVHVTTDEAEIDVSDAGAMTFSRPAVIKVPSPIVEPAAGDAAQIVVTEVSRSLHSYLGVERGHKIEAVLVAGGTGIEPRVAAELQRRLQTRVEILDPSAALGLETSEASASAFVAAIGLALGHGSESGLPVDFLNPKRPPVQRDRRKMMAIATAAALVLILAGVFSAGASRYWSAQAALAERQDELVNLTNGNRGAAALQKRLVSLDGWVQGGRNWLDHWAVLSGVFPPCEDTYIKSLKAGTENTISIMVNAKSPQALGALSEKLRGAGYEVKIEQENSTVDPYGYRSAMGLRVIAKPGMALDLDSLPMPERPANDASGERFGRTGFAVRGTVTPPVATPPPVSPPAKTAEPPAKTPPKTVTPPTRTVTPPSGFGGSGGPGRSGGPGGSGGSDTPVRKGGFRTPPTTGGKFREPLTTEGGLQ